jgi:putative membrane protein insertion efficiency factor
MIARLLAPVRFALATFLVGGVRFYQVCLRPMLPAVCRFEPSCSEYFILAVNKYGPVRGACKGVGRLCRCHPWGRGGWDPP